MPTYRPQFTAKPTKYAYPPIVCDGRLNQASPSIYTSNHISRDGRSSLPPPLAFVYVATGGRASQIQTHVYPLHYSTAPCATNDNAIAQLRLSIALGSLHEACFGKKPKRGGEACLLCHVIDLCTRGPHMGMNAAPNKMCTRGGDMVMFALLATRVCNVGPAKATRPKQQPHRFSIP